MTFDLYAEVEHAKYRDNFVNKIEKLGFKLTKDIDDYSDDDLKNILKLIKKLK